jgi:hypothetical protein
MKLSKMRLISIDVVSHINALFYILSQAHG